MRNLESIQNELVLLNRYKDKLEEERDNTKEEGIKHQKKKEINEVDKQMVGLQIEANEWAKSIIEEEQIEMPEEDKEELNLGEIISIVPDSKKYTSEDRAIIEEDGERSHYQNYEDKRIVLGLAISKEDELYRIYGCTKDGKSKVKKVLNDNGKIESVLVGNIDREEELKNYKGDYLSANEINKNAEGWYNINSIIKDNKKFHKK